MNMGVNLPALLAIDYRENGNVIRQLLVPSRQYDAEVHACKEGRCRGFTIKPPDGEPSVLFITTNAQPPADWDHIVRLRGLDVDPAAQDVDLSNGQWVTHPSQVEVPRLLADFESRVNSARDSWQDTFV